MCFSPFGMVEPALIFQGAGKRISQDEFVAYDRNVDVYWQPNAWVDIAFCLKWAKTHSPKLLPTLSMFVLISDSFAGWY